MPRGSRWDTTFEVFLGQGLCGQANAFLLEADANAPTTYRQARQICPWTGESFEPKSLDLVNEASPLR
jgi:hypothetical protein